MLAPFWVGLTSVIPCYACRSGNIAAHYRKERLTVETGNAKEVLEFLHTIEFMLV